MVKHLSRQVSVEWWGASIAVLLIFVGVVFPLANKVYLHLVPATLNPDVLFYYRVPDLMQMGYALEFPGRIFFILWHFTFDLVWPFVYVLALFFTISKVYRSFEFPLIGLILSTPFLTFLSDVGENVLLSVGMYYFPQRTPYLEWAVYATLAKWVFAGLSLFLIGVGVLVHLIQGSKRFAQWVKQRG